MRKLTEQERQLLRLTSSAGGSVCPGTDTVIPKAGHKALRHLVSRGDLTAEETDDGARFTLTAQGQSEVDHG
jgi:hypothetical protein